MESPAEDGDAPTAPPSDGPGPGSGTVSWWMRALRPTTRRGAWALGSAATLLAAGTAVVNLTLPILTFTAPGGPVHSDWSDLRDPGGLAYEQRLLVLPLVACAGAAVGALFLAWSVRGGGRNLLLVALPIWSLALAGLLLALTGTRWLGFVLARGVEAGPPLVRAHVVPYVDLAVGLLFLAAAAWGLTRLRGGLGPGRWTAASVAAAGLGLLLLPTLPFAYWEFGGGVRVALDEFTLAAVGAQGSPGRLAAPQALEWVRVALWAALGTAVASAVASQTGPLRSPSPRSRWLHWLLHSDLLFLLAAAVLAGRFYERLPHLRPNVSLGPNPFLPVVLAAMGLLWWIRFRRWVRGRATEGQGE